MTRYPLAPRQRRMWVAQQLRDDETVYQITVAFTLHGRLDAAALAHALRGLAQRHEALRTRVEHRDGVPEQVVDDAWDAYTETDLSGLPASEALEAERRELEAEAAHGVDLATRPALRARLLRFGDERHVLVLCVHHMMADMLSMDVVGRDLTELYNARVHGREPRLPVLRLTYGDHARAESEADAERAGSAVEHWASVLDGAPTRLRLPWDRESTTAARGASAVEGITCARATLSGLTASARRTGSTLFAVLLAAFHCYLQRIAGEETTNVGTFVAVRHRSELEELVGLLFDEVPVVVSPREDGPFSEVVAAVRRQLVDALRHPGGYVAEAARRAAGPSAPQAPPFNVTMQMYQRSGGRLAFDGLDIEQHRVFVGAKYDLMLYAAVSETGLDLWFNYDATLFDRPTIRRLLQGFNHLLGQLARETDPLVGDLEVVPPAERSRLLQASRGPTTPYPAEADLDALFREAATAHAARTAVRWDGDGGVATLDYAELDARAGAVAARLGAHGLGAGDVVAVLADRSGWLVPAYLGVLRSGAAILLVDSDTPPGYVRAALAEATAAAVLADERARGRHPLDGLLTVPLEEALTGEGGPAPRALDPLSPAFLVRTSGTTGASKAVVLGHRGISNQVTHRRALFSVTPDDTIALSMSVAFSALPMQLLVPLLSGATLAVCDRSTARDAEALLDFTDRHGVTLLEITPSQLSALFATGAGDPAPRRLRLVVTAGEKLGRGLADEFARRLPAVGLATTWGQSEAGGIMCCGFVTGGPGEISEGRPSANNRVYVLDDRRRPVPFGVEGRAFFAGPSLALGYVGSAASGSAFEPDPWEPGERMVDTGDRVVRRADGGIVVRGRGDAVVKVRGNRVDLGDVAAALRGLPGVRDAHVVARPGDGQELWAYVQAPPEVDAGSLSDALRDLLPDFMRPRTVIRLDEFPRTPNGKLDARALPTTVPDDTRSASAGPLTPWELQVAEAWEHVLGVRVDAESDFFRLGGHSLAAMRLCARVAVLTGAPVPVRTVFEHPVLRDFARAVAAPASGSEAVGS